MRSPTTSHPYRKGGGVATSDEEGPGQRMGLERDLQIALRSKIEQLDPGLTVIDDGAERSVDSGRIDITARDSSGTTVCHRVEGWSCWTKKL